MPNKNTVKVFVPNTYYHVYNRGWNLGKIFFETEDYEHFEYILARYLSDEPVKDSRGREFSQYYPDIELVAYCLMGNHYHLLFYQRDEATLSKIMTSVATAYTAYFNKKYRRRGSLFESTYKAVPILEDIQLIHITRYIHLNHVRYATWPHSSYSDYLTIPRNWVYPNSILELFASKEQYEEFVSDYEELQRERDAIKQDLADG